MAHQCLQRDFHSVEECYQRGWFGWRGGRSGVAHRDVSRGIATWARVPQSVNLVERCGEKGHRKYNLNDCGVSLHHP